jgi:hypothetical protein
MRISLIALTVSLAACSSATEPAPVVTTPVVRVASVSSPITVGGNITVQVRNTGTPGMVRAIAWVRPAPLSGNAQPERSCVSADQPIAAGGAATIALTNCGAGVRGGPIGWLWIVVTYGDTSETQECYALPGVPACPFAIRATP